MKKIILSVLIVTLMIGAVMAHNIDIKTNSVEKDFKQIKQFYPKASIYKVTRNCDDVTLLSRIWDKREILSMETYTDARHPHKEYCGIVYLNIR